MRYLKLDRKYYGVDGLLSLYQGDDWLFSGTVVDRVNGYDTGVDLSQYSAAAYFPSASGGADLPATAATGMCSVLTISMPAVSTPNVAPNSAGQGIYVILTDNAGHIETVPTLDQAVAILQRGFPV